MKEKTPVIRKGSQKAQQSREKPQVWLREDHTKAFAELLKTYDRLVQEVPQTDLLAEIIHDFQKILENFEKLFEEVPKKKLALEVLEAYTKALETYTSIAKDRVLELVPEKELDREIEFFDSEINGELKKYFGKYVAIKNCEVIAVGDTYEEVSEKVKKTPYAKARCILIRKVEKERPIHFVSVPLSVE
ncbi:MAG TPA: DUF5678 domain-containing protein [Candidatus Hypogeohydataceae bacterium YC41]